VALRDSEIRGRGAGNSGPDNLRAEFAILVRSDWTGSRLDAQPSNRSFDRVNGCDDPSLPVVKYRTPQWRCSCRRRRTPRELRGQ